MSHPPFMMLPMETERQLSKLARRQHGLVTLAQAEAVGVSPEAVRWRVRTGRWNRVASGLFALAGTAHTWRQKTMAAVLAAGPGAVASHTTAAALYGLSSCPFKGVEITVPRGRSPRSKLAVVHTSTQLDPVDVASIASIPVTRPARTLVDLAGRVDKTVLGEALDDALIRRLTTLERLKRRAMVLGGTGRDGTSVLRDVLGAWAEGDMPEGVAEMRMVRRLLANGQPKPILQYQVHDPTGRFLARLDAAYPEARVGLEMNGFRWHGTPDSFARDPARLRRLAALGWLILPCTPVDLAGDGAELAEQVAGAMASSRVERGA